MPKPSEYDKTHLRNMAAMGTRIDRIFKKATEEAAKIGVSIKDIDPDKIFSFDDYPETKKQIERLLTALKETTEKTIVNGVRSAWTLSNNKNDAMAEKVFGRDADKLPPEVRMKYFNNNESALQAFLARQQNGLNLSDRVWKYTNAFKQEIELGLDCGIRSGKDAPAMARELKQYLQYPDKLFRRVRDEHGLLQLSKAAADFHPGRGVYRSSYKNARRLAATETNIAYRTNDYLRWQQMDFVVGIEIQLSNNHTILLQPGEKTDDASQQRADGSPKANAVRPFTDICDTLAGRYPKDFKFTGWHPHCRCRAITILKTEEEMAKDNEAILNGEEVSTQSENSVKDVPQAFKDHVLKYGERIENTAPGRLPYYIQDNRKRVDKLLGLNNEPQRTPQEIAAERHANRTEQDKQGIQQAWNESRLNSLQEAINNGYLPEECKARLAELAKLNTPEHFDEFQAQIKTLQAQAQRHAARTPQDIADIKARWEKRVFTNDKIRRDADRVLTLAKSYSEVDYAQLEKLIAQGKLAEMDAETQKVLQALKDMREQERALEDLIPDVHKWHKQFTLAELQEAHNAITKTFNRWTWDYTNETSLNFLKGKLETEINFVAKSAYKTKEIAKKAYEQRLALVESKIELLKINKEYTALLGFKTQSKEFKEFMTYAKQAMDAGEPKTARMYLNAAAKKKASIEAAKAAKAAKKSVGKGLDGYSTAVQTDHPEIKRTEAEKIAQIKDMLNCTEEQAKAYYKAVYGFSWQWDYEIRQVQCGNTKFTSRHGHTLDEIKKRAEDLEEFIRKSPQWKGGTTYRGLSLSDKELKDTMDKLRKGTFDNKGSASWSTDYGVSENFAGSNLGEYSDRFGDEKTNRVVLLLKEQKHATSIRHISRFISEDEVLASKNCRYKFVSKEIKRRYGEDYIYITVEAI
jgi:hypothetical protein